MKQFILAFILVGMSKILPAQNAAGRFSINDFWATPSTSYIWSTNAGKDGLKNGTTNNGVYVGFGFKANDNSKAWKQHSVFKVGVSYSKYSILSPFSKPASAVSPGKTIFTLKNKKSAKSESVYYTSGVSVEWDHLFTTRQENKFSAYVGYRIGLGTAVATNLYKQRNTNVSEIRGKQIPAGTYYFQSPAKSLVIKNGACASIGLPFGVQMRLPKKRDTLSRLYFGLEGQVGMNYYFINGQLVKASKITFPIIPNLRYKF